MKDFISDLRNKSIHVVGVTGAEGSSILRFLRKHNIRNIITHDFIAESEIEKSFKLWHKGLTTVAKEKLWQQFQTDLSSVRLNLGTHYLENIAGADIIFVPQSWRLYPNQNKKLFAVSGKIPFYSLTRLYLDFAPAQIIGVTGTVGKGSTANIIYQVLKNNGRRVYFAGNESWMVQLAEKLDEMTKNELLVLEISHRQLQDGFTRAPYITVLTNLYPNHLDEVSWEEYIGLKLALVKNQKPGDTAVINCDIPLLRLKDKLHSKVLYFSQNNPEMNTKNVQKVYRQIVSMKSDHFLPNLLAGLTVVDFLGINIDQALKNIDDIQALPARLELLTAINGVKIYDDIKSTTPWATLAAVSKLGRNTILICGGRTKGIAYQQFAKEIEAKVKYTIGIKSELTAELAVSLPDNNIWHEANDLKKALDLAFQNTKPGDNILISPAAGYFYSDFIKGKKSVRKLVTSLLPEGQV